MPCCYKSECCYRANRGWTLSLIFAIVNKVILLTRILTNFPLLYAFFWVSTVILPQSVASCSDATAKSVCLQWVKIKTFLYSMCVCYTHISFEAWEFVYLCFTGWLFTWKMSPSICFMSVIQCKNVFCMLSKVLLYLKTLFLNNIHISIWSLKVT
jgi:hypothetical protein